MGLRCSHCGMPIPTLGSICPFCRNERDDVEAQAYGLGCALGLLSFGALVWFAFHQADTALIAAGVGAVLGLIAVRRQMEKLLAVALIFVVFGIPTLFMACPNPFFGGKPPNQRPPVQPVNDLPAQALPVQGPPVVPVQEDVKPPLKKGITLEQTAEHVAKIKERDNQLKGKTMQEVESVLGIANVRSGHFSDTMPIEQRGYKWIYYGKPNIVVLFSMPKDQKELSVFNKESVVVEVKLGR